VWDETVQLVVPVNLRRRLFDLTHSGPSAAHLGSVHIHMVQQLKTHYYWIGMNRDIGQWCRQCVQCAKSKSAPLHSQGQLKKIPVGAPLDLVTTDILSGLPAATDGSKYILVLVDAFTKWVETYLLPDQEAHTCMRAAYAGFFSCYGFPLQLYRDQGRNFKARYSKNSVR